MNNLYGYHLLKKKKGEDFKHLYYCYSYNYAMKIIEMYKRRKIIVIGEEKDDIRKSKWKIVPITKHEAIQAQKDVPF